VGLRPPHQRGQFQVFYTPPPPTPAILAQEAAVAKMYAEIQAPENSPQAAVKEDLVGAMFAVGQTHISEVIAAFKAFAGTFEGAASRPIAFVGIDKRPS
jgi:hypothetical protein